MDSCTTVPIIKSLNVSFDVETELTKIEGFITTSFELVFLDLPRLIVRSLLFVCD